MHVPASQKVPAQQGGLPWFPQDPYLGSQAFASYCDKVSRDDRRGNPTILRSELSVAYIFDQLLRVVGHAGASVAEKAAAAGGLAL